MSGISQKSVLGPELFNIFGGDRDSLLTPSCVKILNFLSSLFQDGVKPSMHQSLELFPTRAEIQQCLVTCFISSQQKSMLMLTFDN